MIITKWLLFSALIPVTTTLTTCSSQHHREQKIPRVSERKRRERKKIYIFPLNIPKRRHPKTLGRWNEPKKRIKSQTASVSYLARWLIYPWCLPKTQYWVMETGCQRYLIFLPRWWMYSKKGEHIFPIYSLSSFFRQAESYLKYHIKIIRMVRLPGR